MDFLQILESESPKLKVSVDKIFIDTSESYNSSIKIENISGGFLRGNIFKNDEYLILSSNVIDKNLVVVEINIDKNKLYEKQKYETYIKIITNGGDEIIPITIINSKTPFKINNIITIYNVSEFYENIYKGNHLNDFIKCFESEEFSKWLTNFNENYFEIYELLKNDKNSHRRIDNFFTLLGYKDKTKIVPIERNVLINILHFQENNIEGIVSFKKLDNSFAEFDITFLKEYNFIKFEKTSFSNQDFNEDNTLDAKFYIDLSLVKNKREDVTIFINDDINNFVKIKIVKKPFIKVHTDKTIYKDKDVGTISVKNFSKIKVNYKAVVSNSNLIIPDSVGVLDNELEINFVVKLSAFNHGIVKFFKQPYFTTIVTLYFETENLKTKKNIEITIATDSLELK